MLVQDSPRESLGSQQYISILLFSVNKCFDIST